PLPTVTGGGRNILAVPYLVPRYGERDGQEPRIRSIDEPAPVVVPTGNGGQLVAAYLAQNNDGFYDGAGRSLDEPNGTVLASGSHQSLVAATLVKNKGTGVAADVADPLHTIAAGGTTHGLVAAHIQRDFGMSVGQPASAPVGTITANGGGKAALVASFLQSYYGAENRQDLREPLRTIPTHDRFGLVTVEIAGEPYVIVDIAMRMLQPRALYRAPGIPGSYIIDRGAAGRRLTKTEQLPRIANAVRPQDAAAR